MGEFFQIGKDITQGFIEGFAHFWAWFTTPMIEGLDLSWINPDWSNLTIAPWMILSFTMLAIIFTVSLIKLIIS